VIVFIYLKVFYKSQKAKKSVKYIQLKLNNNGINVYLYDLTLQNDLAQEEEHDIDSRNQRTDDICDWDSEFVKVDQGTLFQLILVGHTSFTFFRTQHRYTMSCIIFFNTL
jgi:hypothetical protein